MTNNSIKSATNNSAKSVPFNSETYRLALNGSLKKIFSFTSSIESMFSMVRKYNCNVKKWQDNKHIQRTVISALIESESRFHRVEGYRGLKELQTKIRNMRATTSTIKAAA